MSPIPAGWKLVPIEPTEEMLVALGGMGWMVQQKPESYAAMLAAAPSPASVAPGDAQKVYHFEQRSRFGPWVEVEKPTAKSVEFVKRSNAPAAGDALALLDHPLLRDVLGYIEDAGPADVWGAAQSWMALRDAALAAQVPQQGEA